jgi:hypothetical protein
MTDQAAVPEGRSLALTERREFPSRDKQPVGQDLDENGDVIFRFKLDPVASGEPQSLREFYRQSLYDLLRVVRLYSRGTPLIVDSFAFLNEPHNRIPILDPTDAAATGNGAACTTEP